MPSSRQERAAFTLVELLAVLVVMGILAGMVTAALASVKESARAAKTRGIIAAIDEVLQAKWEEYRVRPFSVVVPNPFTADPTMSPELRPVESARVRLLMVRDLMRMELPDRQSDILTDPMTITARVRPLRSDGARGTFMAAPVSWWSSGVNQPALYTSYNDRVSRNPDSSLRWTRQHEGAECLYLILSTTFQNGVNGLEMIPPGNIGDTDEDGMPEVLDGWGRPLGFLRWPVGAATDDDLPELPSDATFSTEEYAEQRIGPDEFDPFRADFGYRNGDTSVVQPFSLRPLIVSAGPDGEFDLRFTKSSGYGAGTPAGSAYGYAYRNQVWPNNRYPAPPTVPFDESIGRPNPYYFMDPYQRYDPDTERFGEPVDFDGDGDNTADNISNYNLETTS